ncbi:hypothetical protein TNCV_2568731 [Trichonephila clavipes]|uniref:Uncharacterized protein n=1 Tax=Trichonephila clavipes TaxID=2585209 RepID=A0A8X6WNG5_TRICX|nr:hypothetical protein TNCV_2568731 [Trichonephila clavipes]
MGSKDKKLFYENEFGILNASSDASWGNAENGKSFSGGVVLLGGNLIFQQDNDLKHRSRNVKNVVFFIANNSYVPPQPSDINVIENLWLTFETAVQKYKIRNKTHLNQELKEE